MGARIKTSLGLLLCASTLGRAAVDLGGNQVVQPLSEDDPSPINDIYAYDVDQNACPLACVDYGNTHSWTPYLSVERLGRCSEPMLLQFSVTQPLDDPESNILIRSCSLKAGSRAFSMSNESEPIDNPKNDDGLYQGGSLDSAAACTTRGHKRNLNLELGMSSALDRSEEKVARAARLLDGMQRYFSAKDSCNENFLFAYHQEVVISMYIGEHLGKPTALSALENLASHLRTETSSPSNQTVAQLCSDERPAERAMGISINLSGDLAAVQKATLEWSKGDCTMKGHIKPAGYLSNVEVIELTSNSTTGNNEEKLLDSRSVQHAKAHNLRKRAVCKYIEIKSGDGCPSLATRCGISGADFTKYNSKASFCSTLQPGGYACCSAGDPYTKPKPKPGADGVCANRLIANGDTCDKIASQYGITAAEIESWNKGKTWAWTACKDMLVGYNMCISSGRAPLPPPQKGAICGPLVPGTKLPSDTKVSIASLNPCPLKACCSNWGFCGVFPAHCDVHAPAGGGPGTKEKGYESTCVSGCGTDIKQNSGPPSAFRRIGYYESFAFDRKCLWLKVKNANLDGTYTHIHWSFAGIDPKTFQPIITDKHNQWADFKKLPEHKILAFGGWAYSTEPATYGIIRSAILNNAELFATNLAKFVTDQGLDGIDIDWEYPGATDILVDGKPIGQEGDGAGYLKFLTLLKQKLGSKLLSIAAPASFWYLRAFPIDKIAAVVNHIVYMTYDLHGQWDYGNVNAFDKCPSGKCIRSHINVTETASALAMLTKAGVPNNKIYVGEASYGRSFRMAKDGCWGPLCDFTGSRTQSNANAGRCTNTRGYLAFAEITELITRGDGVRLVQDKESDTDVLLYKGDAISYMTPKTKLARRDRWSKLNFAGTIDWAVDLQKFGDADFTAIPARPTSGTGCVAGKDRTLNSGDLCEFTCYYGFCPTSLCECSATDTLRKLPSKDTKIKGRSFDSISVDLNQLCNFACSYGFCPSESCTTRPEEGEEKEEEADDEKDDVDRYDYEDARAQNANKCYVYKDTSKRALGLAPCLSHCSKIIEEAEAEGEVSNYGCVGFFPLDKPIPWTKAPNTRDLVAPGECNCDNFLVNELATFILDALPIIAQIGCYVLMSSVKFILDVGAQFIPGIGRVLDAGLDMAATAAQMTSYIYDKDQSPQDAFAWWLSPCGGSDLVPEEFKKLFDILNLVPTDKTSFKTPLNIPKGSGKKGDEGNPRAPATRPTKGGSPNSGPKKPKPAKKKCNVKSPTTRSGYGKNTLQVRTCDKNGQTQTKQYVVHTLNYAANAIPTAVVKECQKKYPQACYHYSSANRENNSWKTLTCPQEAATAGIYRFSASATSTWAAEHTGAVWKDKASREYQDICDMDEWPPAALLNDQHPAWINAGINKVGQRIRYLPMFENRGVAGLWKGVCFKSQLAPMSDRDLMDLIARGTSGNPTNPSPNLEQVQVRITVPERPEFSMTYEHSKFPLARDDGLWDNKCWPKKLAVGDPGFALLGLDTWYDNNPQGPNKQRQKWNYRKPYVKGTNGD